MNNSSNDKQSVPEMKATGQSGVQSVSRRPPIAITVDAHIHILSGNCSPMPFLWYTLLQNKFGRTNVILTKIQSSFLNVALNRIIINEKLAPIVPTVGEFVNKLGAACMDIALLMEKVGQVNISTQKISKMVIDGAIWLWGKTEPIYVASTSETTILKYPDFVCKPLAELLRLIKDGLDISTDEKVVKSKLSQLIRDKSELDIVNLQLFLSMEVMLFLINLELAKIDGDEKWFENASMQLCKFEDTFINEISQVFILPDSVQINYLECIAKEFIAFMEYRIESDIIKNLALKDFIAKKTQEISVSAGALLNANSKRIMHYAKLLSVQNRTTRKIAQMALTSISTIFSKESSLTPIVPLPMDMEYAHLDRFCCDEDRAKMHQIVSCRYISMGMNVPVINKSIIVYAPPLFTPPVGAKGYNKVDKTNYYYNKRISAMKWIPVWLPLEEYDLYEKWSKQILNTALSAFDNPWQVCPLFHYEPRRWTLNRTEPLGTIARSTVVGKYPDVEGLYRVFMGFKMYPSLGYKPLDPRLPALSGKSGPTIYQLCVENDLPIMTHCSPGGAINQDVYYYMDYDYLDAKNRNDVVEMEKISKYMHLKNNKGKELSSDDKSIQYFRDNYASPSAWEQVLKVYKDLRICFAHFGGSDISKTGEPLSGWNVPIDKYGSEWDTKLWNQKILQLIEQYENVYTDFSYFFLLTYQDQLEIASNAEEMEKLEEIIDICRINLIAAFMRSPKLKDRLLFGTDWYMTEADRPEYSECANRTKKEIDWLDTMLYENGIDGFGPGNPTLWQRITMINPWKFYKFDDYYKNFTTTLKNNAKKFSSDQKKIIKDYYNNDINFYINKHLSLVSKINKKIMNIEKK